MINCRPVSGAPFPFSVDPDNLTVWIKFHRSVENLALIYTHEGHRDDLTFAGAQCHHVNVGSTHVLYLLG
jgi:hypothetical protein